MPIGICESWLFQFLLFNSFAIPIPGVELELELVSIPIPELTPALLHIASLAYTRPQWVKIPFQKYI